jgi:hypothetical protein
MDGNYKGILDENNEGCFTIPAEWITEVGILRIEQVPIKEK